MALTDKCTLSFTDLIDSYKKLQSKLVVQVKKLASQGSQATPGSFILLQFQMSQVTQIGESISNLISQVNSLINKAVQNQQAR
jgi:uncharacterized phage infection (PIP) family protein YhgE